MTPSSFDKFTNIANLMVRFTQKKNRCKIFNSKLGSYVEFIVDIPRDREGIFEPKAIKDVCRLDVSPQIFNAFTISISPALLAG